MLDERSSVRVVIPEHPQFPGSPDLRRVEDGEGRSWAAARAELSPRYAEVWRDIGRCYALALSGPAFNTAAGLVGGPLLGWAAALPSAMWSGYWLASLSNFMHEAAHFNLHPDRKTNDRLADWVVCTPFFRSIADYRAIHWQHHLQLGQPDDTEVSYHNAPTVGFLLRASTGVHLLRVMLGRRRRGRDAKQGPARRGGGGRARASGKRGALARFVAFHGSVVGSCLAAGQLPAAVSWSLGVVNFLPLFVTVRQLLEHRSLHASATADYRRQVHGAVNRLFGTDRLSRTLGSAGFNRHLLHHWEPSISYTRFDDMEDFLRGTPLADSLDEARTSYWATAYRLMTRAGDPNR